MPGIAVTQANHPRIVEGGGRGGIETACEVDQALANRRWTNEDQPIGSGVGQHLDRRISAAFAQRGLHHSRHISSLCVLHLHHGMLVVLPGIQLPDHLRDTVHIGRSIGDHQRIG
ncbi:hypothetical protein D3C84_719900 [compost metagenome]